MASIRKDSATSQIKTNNIRATRGIFGNLIVGNSGIVKTSKLVTPLITHQTGDNEVKITSFSNTASISVANSGDLSLTTGSVSATLNSTGFKVAGDVGIIENCNIAGDLVNNDDLIIQNNDLQTEVLTGYIDQGYEVKDSSVLSSGWEGFRAFDNSNATSWASVASLYDDPSGNYIGAATTIIDTTSYPGEWLQIKFPFHVRVESYKLRIGSVDNTPNAWILAGSNDAITWSEVGQGDDATYPLTIDASTTPIINSGTPASWLYYRLVITSTNNVTIGTARIGDMLFYGRRLDSKYIQAEALHAIGCVDIGGCLTVDGVFTNAIEASGLSINSGKAVNINQLDLITDGLTAPVSFGFTASSSTDDGSFTAFRAFDKSTSTRWQSATNTYDPSDGSAIAGVTTTFTDASTSIGQYINLIFPVNMYITGYKIVLYSGNSVPVKFRLGGRDHSSGDFDLISDYSAGYDGPGLSTDINFGSIIAVDTPFMGNELRLSISEINPGGDDEVIIRELIYYGGRVDANSIKTQILHCTDNLAVDGNVEVIGDLKVNGSTTTVDSLIVDDCMVEICANNPADTLSAGVLFESNNGSPQWGGMMRKAAGDFYVFNNVSIKPTPATDPSTLPLATIHGKFILGGTVPVNAAGAGVVGEIAFSPGFIYFCIAANTWQRVVVATY
jgi:hypothetical protein